MIVNVCLFDISVFEAMVLIVMFRNWTRVRTFGIFGGELQRVSNTNMQRILGNKRGDKPVVFFEDCSRHKADIEVRDACLVGFSAWRSFDV